MAGAGNESDGPDVLLVRLDSDNAAALELMTPIGEDKIGHLLDRGINGADQRYPLEGALSHAPERQPDQVADEHADDVDEQDGQRHAEQAGAEIVVVELPQDVMRGLEWQPFSDDGVVPADADEVDDIAADIVPEKIPNPDEQPKGDESRKDCGKSAEEESLEIIDEPKAFWPGKGGLILCDVTGYSLALPTDESGDGDAVKGGEESDGAAIAGADSGADGGVWVVSLG